MTDSLSALPAELASIVNRYVLDTVLFHIKPASFSKYGSPSQDRKINPYRGQWLVPVVRTPCSSLLLSHFHNARVAADVRDLALSLHPSLLVSRSKALDNRESINAKPTPLRPDRLHQKLRPPRPSSLLRISESRRTEPDQPIQRTQDQSRAQHRQLRQSQSHQTLRWLEDWCCFQKSTASESNTTSASARKTPHGEFAVMY